MCHFSTKDGHGRQCDGAGDILACQLCPNSLTYWRNTAPEAAADPYDGTTDPEVCPSPIADPLPDYSGVIDAKAEGYYAVGRFGAEPCILCLKPTITRSRKHVPVHLVCASEYRAGRRAFASPR